MSVSLGAIDALGIGVDTPKGEKLKSAVGQFEALLIAQMLKNMREADGEGWLGTGSDASGAHLIGLAEEQMAQALSAQGGLGLAQFAADSFQK